MLNNESIPSKHSYKSLEFTDAKSLQKLRCVTEVSVGIESVNLVLYRVYQKKLNRFEIALNFAKHLFVSGFIYI